MAVDGSNSETSQSNSAEEISVGDMMGVAASTAAGERAGTSKRKKGGFSRSNLIQFFYNESYQTPLFLRGSRDDSRPMQTIGITKSTSFD